MKQLNFLSDTQILTMIKEHNRINRANKKCDYDKLKHTQNVIHCWVESFTVANVYVAFSGGKDSTVLLDIARKLYPDITAVFNNTGLEMPEIVSFVRTFDNVIELNPRMSFHKVIKKYGWPVISKEQSQFIKEYRTTKSSKLRDLRYNGRTNGRSKIAEKWKFAINAPFKISNVCCDKLKKEPAKRFEKQTGMAPMIGVMEEEGQLRKGYSCNLYDSKRPISKPILKWNANNIWGYINENNTKYCEIYDKGYNRTGCVFCMYGAHMEKQLTRFQMLKIIHPNLHRILIDKLGAKEVLDYMKIKY